MHKPFEINIENVTIQSHPEAYPFQTKLLKHSQIILKDGLPLFQRNPESSCFKRLQKIRTPAFTGVTIYCESIISCRSDK